MASWKSIVVGSCLCGVAWAEVAEGKDMRFPEKRPERASYPRPDNGEVSEVSPPGFCWWRAGKPGHVHYKLKIHDGAGKLVHESPRLVDPVHAPDEILPSGEYSWIVKALDEEDAVLDVR